MRQCVTPLAGVWVEMLCSCSFVSSCSVTPLAGVWVEIPTAYEPYTGGRPSLPSRECGLKYKFHRSTSLKCIVTPLAGVWVEINNIPAGN